VTKDKKKKKLKAASYHVCMNAKYSLPSSLSELVVDLECLVVVIGESAATAGIAVVLGAVAVGGGVVIVSMKLY
jgi:hypothetical protein